MKRRDVATILIALIPVYILLYAVVFIPEAITQSFSPLKEDLKELPDLIERVRGG